LVWMRGIMGDRTLRYNDSDASGHKSISPAPVEERGSGTSEQRRRELADFLRIRREKLKPEQMGLAQGARRRTPGLRREEVAELAGVGTTWYTWLEQARDIQPSSEVLRRLGQALKLNSAEMRHMFSLAGKAPPMDVASETEVATESIMRLLNQSLQVPAILLGSRWDILHVNEHAAKGFPPMTQLPEGRRNWLYFTFCDSALRKNISSWESNARRLIAEFRASLSESLDNPWVLEMVNLLKAESPEFAQWWREHDVRDNNPTMVEVQNPETGVVHRYERSILRPLENERMRILLFTPIGA
jgi:transcriptional regulator with XRE-family HTH domain